ncbi:MAG: beta-ketoacyl-ACP reductase [Candidatus Porifericomitaceae bacterium WSBS_2022_MAG_OTU9]
MKLEHGNKLAVVTGGTGSLGTAICRQLAISGARVVTCYRNIERAAVWLEDNKEYGILGIQADVSKYEDCKSMAEEISSKFPDDPVSILVNNAGITADSSLRNMTKEQWSSVLSINLDSAFNVCSNIMPSMLKGKYGRIVNISSINGQRGQLGQCNYAAAKAGLHGFTKSLAREVARKNITVNTISPGYLESDMVAKVPENILEQIRTEIPLGRFGRVDEVAAVVNFICCEYAGLITGADVPVNGGHFIY